MTDAAASIWPLITATDLYLTLPSAAGDVEILRGVNFTAMPGEALAVVGPSGSGKSSLMAVLSGLERATTGRVEVDGADLGTLDEDALARFRRGRVGIILQSFHLVPTMTALENAAIPLELMGDADAMDKAAAELEAVGLSHRLDHYPAQLSGGEQQRVAIARALASKPRLLFADEPTGNLDSVTGQAIIDLMFRLHDERKTTLVMITHDAQLAARADRIYTMRDGLLYPGATDGGGA
jgi:putative ABC transport system ATP-binding protein